MIGRDFDLDLLLEVADVDEDTALDLLDGATAAQLVENIAPDRYCFAHALVQHALYEDLTPTRRAHVPPQDRTRARVAVGCRSG